MTTQKHLDKLNKYLVWLMGVLTVLVIGLAIMVGHLDTQVDQLEKSVEQVKRLAVASQNPNAARTGQRAHAKLIIENCKTKYLASQPQGLPRQEFIDNCVETSVNQLPEIIREQIALRVKDETK